MMRITNIKNFLYIVVILALIIETIGLIWLYSNYRGLSDRYRYITWNMAIKNMQCLKDKIELLLYLSNNTSDTTLVRIVAKSAAEHSSIAANLLLALAKYEGEEYRKIYVLHASLSNMKVYFNSLANNPEKASSLAKDRELLEKIFSILKEVITTYRQSPKNLPNSLVLELQKASEEL